MRRFFVLRVLVLTSVLVLSGAAISSVSAASGCNMITRLGDQNPTCPEKAMPPSGGMMSGAMPTGGMGAGTSMPMTAGSIDQQFIDMMVPHHQMAVMMAQMAQMHAVHPEIKQLANNIIASQSAEIAQMKQWRKAWFGSDVTPTMAMMPMLAGMPESDMMAMSHMMADMQQMQTAMPFDKVFMQMMIPHHQSAIDAAKIELQQGQHPELKNLASAIISAQQKEIDQMQQWLKAWYP